MYKWVFFFLVPITVFGQIHSYKSEGPLVRYELADSAGVEWGRPPAKSETQVRFSMYVSEIGEFCSSENNLVQMRARVGDSTTILEYSGFYRIEQFGSVYRESLACNIPHGDIELIKQADLVWGYIGDRYLVWRNREGL